MRRLISSMLLLLVSAGCANQLALSELSARNTVPPPGTQMRAPTGGSGYYNPLSLFQGNPNNANPNTFTPPAPNQGLATSPIAPANPTSETTSPFWNLPSAAINTPSQPPVTDRWASRGSSSGASSLGDNRATFNGSSGNFSGGNSPVSVPAPSNPVFGNGAYTAVTPNAGNSNFGRSGFGSNGFGNSGYQNRGPVGLGNQNPAPGVATNPLGDLFTKLFGPAPGTRPSGVNNQPNWSQPAPAPNGFATRPNSSASQPAAPRFDFGSPRSAPADGEPAIKISDSALRELPRNPRGVSTTPTNPAQPQTPLARQPAAPVNNLPAAPSARPLPQQESEYIEITRLPAARTAT